VAECEGAREERAVWKKRNWEPVPVEGLAGKRSWTVRAERGEREVPLKRAGLTMKGSGKAARGQAVEKRGKLRLKRKSVRGRNRGKRKMGRTPIWMVE